MRRGVLEILLVVASFAIGFVLATDAWAGSSSYADSKDTYDIVFTYTSGDALGDIGTYQNACRSGIAYLEDGSTGTIRMHSVPKSSTTVGAATTLGDITTVGLAGAIGFNDNPGRFLKVEKLSAGSGSVRVRCANFVVASSELGFAVTFEGTQGASCAGITDVIGGTAGTPQSGTDCNFVGPGVVEGNEALRATGAHYIDFFDTNTDLSGKYATWSAYFSAAPSGDRGMIRPLTSIGSANNPRVLTNVSFDLSVNCTTGGAQSTGVQLVTDEQYWFKQYWDRGNDEYNLKVWNESGQIIDFDATCDGAGVGLRIGADANAVDEVYDAYQIWDGDPGNLSGRYFARSNQAVALGAGTSDTDGTLNGSGSTCWGTCTYLWSELTAFGCVIDDDAAPSTTFSGCTSGETVEIQLSVSSEWPASVDSVQIDLAGVPTGFPFTFPFNLQ